MKCVTCMFISLVVGLVTASAAEPEEVEKALAAKDFWAKVGVKTGHGDLTAATVEKVAEKTKSDAVRLRAAKILCDLNGKARYLSDLKETDLAKAVAGAFTYLEDNLKDETVKKFRPEKGFTHLSLSKKSDDPEGVWLLIEDTQVGVPGSGLNIRWNPKAGKVDKVEHWGVAQ